MEPVIGPETKAHDTSNGASVNDAVPVIVGKAPGTGVWERLNIALAFTAPVGFWMLVSVVCLPVKPPVQFPVTSTRAALKALALTPQVSVPAKVSLVLETEAVALIESAPLPAVSLRLFPVTLPCSTVSPQTFPLKSPVSAVPF
jgi:hypothetical protein